MSDPGFEEPPLGDPHTDDPTSAPESPITTEPDGTPKENPSGG